MARTYWLPRQIISSSRRRLLCVNPFWITTTELASIANIRNNANKKA